MSRLRLLRARLVKTLLLVVAVALLFVGQGGPCAAHPGNVASVLAKVQPNGTFTLHFRFDLLAYVVGELPNRIGDAPMNALLDGSPADLERQLTDAKARFAQSIRINDGGPQNFDSLTFPNASEVLHSVKNVRMRLPVMASVTATGHLPPGTKTVRFQFDETLGAVVLTTEFPYQEPFSEPVDAGAFSSEQTIPSTETVARAMAAASSVTAKEAAPASQTSTKLPPTPKAIAPRPIQKVPPVKPAATLVSAVPIVAASASSPVPSPSPHTAPREKTRASGTPSPTPSASPAALAPKPSAPTLSQKTPPVEAPPATHEPERKVRPLLGLEHFVGYVKMGYTHILPEGVDHILFVLGLFLLTLRIKPLLWQITAFTVAHSLSLALSLYGVVHLPSTIVEPIIAASIVFVAVENIFTKEMKPWRPALVFGFGLIHGLGFAAALQEIGLQKSNFLTALVGFNVGVELGQLSVVALAFLLVGWFRNRPGYRTFVVIPGSLLIALVALFWTFQRILPPG